MKLIPCYIISAVISVLIVAWTFSIRVSLYRMRNIAYPAGIIAGLFCMSELLLRDGSVIDALLAFPADFARITIWLIGILGVLMLISNVSLMRHEGMRPTNMIGTFLGVIFVGGTVAIYFISVFLSHLAETTQSTAALFAERFLPLWFYFLLDYCECFMLGIIIMGWIAALQKPQYDKDFIIIPGCSISKTGGLLPLLRGRTNRAVRYAWDQEIATGRKMCYVPSGGQGADEIMSEGSAMELYLLAHGAEADEVFPERQSVNTYENFALSKKVIDAQKPGARVAFSTTNYHVLRCGLLAHRVGLDAEGIASSTKWYFWPNGFAREVVAIFAMSRKGHAIAALMLTAVSLAAVLL